MSSSSQRTTISLRTIIVPDNAFAAVHPARTSNGKGDIQRAHTLPATPSLKYLNYLIHLSTNLCLRIDRPPPQRWIRRKTRLYRHLCN